MTLVNWYTMGDLRRLARRATTPPVKVACYLRVSTADQGKSGLGLEAQRAKLEAAAVERGWETVWEQDVQTGRTGSADQRAGLQRALLLAREGAVDAIAVAKLDRMARSTVDVLHILERARGE